MTQVISKFLIQLVLFLLFTTFLYVVSVPIWFLFTEGKLNQNISYKRFGYGHLYSRLDEVKTVNNVDILFLGSSHAYRGFDNRIFNKYQLSTFNLGSSAQSPIQTKLLLDRYLDKLNPKLVVYELCETTINSDGAESGIDLISNSQIDLSSLFMVFEIRSIRLFNTFIWVIFNEIFLSKTSFEEKIKGDDMYINGGFVERIRKTDFKATNKRKPYEIGQIKNIEKINVILSDLKKRKIKYLIVSSPVTANWYNTLINRNQFVEIMSSLGDYIDFTNPDIFNNYSHFYDDHHLSQEGVVLFNNILIDTLMERYPMLFEKKDSDFRLPKEHSQNSEMLEAI